MTDLYETPEATRRLQVALGENRHHLNGRAPELFTARELQAMQFPPLQWTIPGILPQGAAMLVGPPKVGKSRLALQLGLSRAFGGIALSHTECGPGGVLMLALEDGQRRLQSRIGALLTDVREPWPVRLVCALKWPRLDEGGQDALDRFLTENADIRFVIVDVLQMIRSEKAARDNAYGADYAAGRAVKEVADAHDATILVVHHTRKLDANDPVELASGTNGLTGAFDSILILQREPNGGDATLYLRGRVVEEQQFTLAYDRERGAWNIDGDARAVPLTDTRETIVRALELAFPGTLSPKEIADRTDLTDGVVRQRLMHLDQAGLIHRIGRGRYTIVTTSAREP